MNSMHVHVFRHSNDGRTAGQTDRIGKTIHMLFVCLSVLCQYFV